MKIVYFSLKSLFLVVGLIISFSCGVSESEHNKVKSERDSLSVIVAELESEKDELKNGEERIIGLIESSCDANKFIEARRYIDLLLSNHPESQKRKHYSNLLPKIEEKANEELAIIESDKNDSIRLANINNLGIWEIGYFVDSFGEPTNDKYIKIKRPIYGTFSNSATQNSDLGVRFIISGKNSIYIMLYEYNRSNPVKGYRDKYRVLVKDCDGEKYNLSASSYDSDRLSFDVHAYDSDYNKSNDAERMFDILLKGGEIKFKIIDTDRSTTNYNFMIHNADWFENAYIKLTN